MKLNNLSRLTALLLAIMMLTSVIATGEGLDFTDVDYNRALLEKILSLPTAQERSDTLMKYDADSIAALMWLYYDNDAYGYMDAYPEALCYCYAEKENTLYPYQDSRHNIDCPWCDDAEVVTGIVPGATDAAGNVTSYNLILLDVDGNPVTVAKSTMLDGKYHYFQDTTTNLYVAYLHTDESGAQWIIPLESKY